MKTILFLLAGLLGVQTCVSQTSSPTSVATVKLVDAFVTQIGPTNNFRLGESVLVTVNNLSNLLMVAKLKSKQVVLFVDGNELSDVHPTGVFLETNTLRFDLKRTASTKSVWAPILRKPTCPCVRPLLVSVGVQGDPPLLISESAKNATLTVLEWNWWTRGWAFLFVLFLVIFYLLARYSDVLKDSEKDGDGRFPFSLSRTQSAFWLFISVMSFVFIWVITSDLSTLNGSVLGLIGISAGTYVAASMVGSPSSQAKNQTPPDATGAVANTLLRIQKVPIIGVFLGDILSDSKGISIPRFQIFVWNIVLGIMFCTSVINELAMPEFNGTLLALMGISSATYVGAKLSG